MSGRDGRPMRIGSLPGRWAALVATVLLAAACQDAVDDPVVDERSFERRLELLEELRIDGHDEVLVPIRDVAVGEHGRIAVIQGQTHTVRIFDASGRALGAVGGEGDGPGEFRDVSAVGWLGEALWTLDRSADRLTVFATDLSVARTDPLPDSIRIDGRPARLSVMHPRADGSLVAHALVPDADGGWRSQRFVRVGPGDDVIEIARRPPLEDWFQFRSWYIPIPFGRATHVDVSPEGGLLVLARAVRPDAQTGRVEVVGLAARGPEADTLWSRAIDVEQERVPEGTRDSAIDANVETYASVPVPGMEQAYRRDVDVPETFPPLTGVVAGGDGRIWLEMRAGGELRTYLILENGAPFGRVEVPSNVRIVQAVDGQVWAIETDEVGVEHVVRYRISGGTLPDARREACGSLPEPETLVDEDGAVLRVWSFPLEEVHTRPVLPDDPALRDYRTAVREALKDVRHPELIVPDSLTPEEEEIWADEAHNNALVYGGEVGTVAPISCLDALLFAEQHRRVSQLERPTEFLASVLLDEAGERVVVVFGAGQDLFPPRSVYGFDVVDDYLAERWTYWYALHNHTLQRTGDEFALGVPAPSTSDISLARNLADERELESVHVTNGFYTLIARTEELSRLRGR